MSDIKPEKLHTAEKGTYPGISLETEKRCRIIAFEALEKQVIGVDAGLTRYFSGSDLTKINFSLYIKVGKFLVEYITTKIATPLAFDKLKDALRLSSRASLYILRCERAFLLNFIQDERRRRVKHLDSVLKSDQEGQKIADHFDSLSNMAEVLINRGLSADVLNTCNKIVSNFLANISEKTPIIDMIIKIYRKDPALFEHSALVTVLTVWFGKSILGIEGIELTELGLSALFHDLGKHEVPKEILNKISKLSVEEMILKRKHTIHGRNAIEQLVMQGKGVPMVVAQVCMQHHERFAGGGYPLGLSGEAEKEGSKGICKFARIIAITNYYATLSSDTGREKPLQPKNICEKLSALSKTHFDPKLTKLFVDAITSVLEEWVVPTDSGKLKVGPSKKEAQAVVFRKLDKKS